MRLSNVMVVFRNGEFGRFHLTILKTVTYHPKRRLSPELALPATWMLDVSLQSSEKQMLGVEVPPPVEFVIAACTN